MDGWIDKCRRGYNGSIPSFLVTRKYDDGLTLTADTILSKTLLHGNSALTTPLNSPLITHLRDRLRHCTKKIIN